ncbi:hypothetical protein LSCM1_06216 [Leishmania martiniquensis]|uniref:Uncharacterized protein n=1 Tax=Leishmania martiniquensis TaxID=1580590 RepID=A0A836HFR8_9TRYP|nr:hypothetical protein LSCM1_06216 [Leishmania martiniquensis]
MHGNLCNDGHPPLLSNGLCNSEGDDAVYDSELLDAMGVAEDTSSFLRARAECTSAPPSRHEVASSVPGESVHGLAETISPKAADLRAAAPPSGLPTSLLIGRSLFGRDAPSSSPAAMARGKMLYPTGAIGSAAVYVLCPFTRSRVALCSPHWGHLLAAGFRLRMSLHRGRHVVLQRPHVLLARACQLQGRHTQDCKTTRGTPTPLCRISYANAFEDCRRARTQQELQAALFRKWGWSARLQQTLGATLSSAPLEDAAAFTAAVEADMFAGGFCDSARLIQVTRALGGHSMTSEPLNKQQRATDWRVGAQNGHAVTRYPWSTRSRVLQAPSSWRLGRTPASTTVSWVGASASETTRSPLQLPNLLPTWTDTYTHRPTLRLFGLPAAVRAAFLDLPFPSPSSPSTSLTPAALRWHSWLGRCKRRWSVVSLR